MRNTDFRRAEQAPLVAVPKKDFGRIWIFDEAVGRRFGKVPGSVPGSVGEIETKLRVLSSIVWRVRESVLPKCTVTPDQRHAISDTIGDTCY